MKVLLSTVGAVALTFCVAAASAQTPDSQAVPKVTDRIAPNAGKTVGAAPSGGTNLTADQRAQIRQLVVGSGPKAANVSFALSVGTIVPHDVRVAEVPTVLVDLHPEWRGYRYFVANDQIVIVEPDTHRIVAILDV